MLKQDGENANTNNLVSSGDSKKWPRNWMQIRYLPPRGRGIRPIEDKSGGLPCYLGLWQSTSHSAHESWLALLNRAIQSETLPNFQLFWGRFWARFFWMTNTCCFKTRDRVQRFQSNCKNSIGRFLKYSLSICRLCGLAYSATWDMIDKFMALKSIHLVINAAKMAAFWGRNDGWESPSTSTNEWKVWWTPERHPEKRIEQAFKNFGQSKKAGVGGSVCLLGVGLFSHTGLCTL